MMRTTELLALAKRHGIKMITIAALQEYRKCHEKLVDCVAVTKDADEVWKVSGIRLCEPFKW